MRFPIISPMPIFINSSGGGHLTGAPAVVAVIVFGFIFWALIFLIVLTITDKYKYSELSSLEKFSSSHLG
jgi:predicted membrane protein